MNQSVLAACLTMMSLCSPARAGEFFEAHGMAIGGYDPVLYFENHQAVLGTPAYVFSYHGSLFHFANARDRGIFAANPSEFAPQYNGFCTFGVATGAKVASNPNSFRIIDGKLYLQYSDAVSRQFDQDVPGNLRKAEANWPSVRTKQIER
jgi:hypothetical protein